MELFGQIAVVTNAASGVGFMVAWSLFRAGAFVYLADEDENRGREAVERLGAFGHDLQKRKFVRMAANDPDSVNAAIARILEDEDGIDILVNSSDWRRRNEGRQNAGMLQAFLPAIVRQGGKIINIASGSDTAELSQLDFNAWAEKNVVATTRDLAKNLDRHGISVNCICLNSDPSANPGAASRSDQGEIGEEETRGPCYPAEIENATLLFARSSSNHITGQTLRLTC